MNTIKLNYSLRRTDGSKPANALLLFNREIADLFTICAATGVDPARRVFSTADGFLIKLDRSIDAPIPGTVRLRAIAENFYIPFDAELTPALHDDEARGLVRDRGVVFLPGGRVLGFLARNPLDLGRYLSYHEYRDREWTSFPTPPFLSDRIVAICYDFPNTIVEDIEQGGSAGNDRGKSTRDAGGTSNERGEANPRGSESNDRPNSDAAESMNTGSPIGTDPLETDIETFIKKISESFCFFIGEMLESIGRSTRSSRMSAFGSRLKRYRKRRSFFPPKSTLDRQAAALERLLREFREGDVDKALRKSPEARERGDARIDDFDRSAILRQKPMFYSLRRIVARVPTSTWLGGERLWNELYVEYRKAAEAAERRGDFRRAAVIYGKLLKDYRSAAEALKSGGLHRDAAIVFLEKANDERSAAESFESAGDHDLALALYRKVKEYARAGDLLKRLGDDDAALVEYVRAADDLAKNAAYHAAGELLKNRANRSDLAEPYYAKGWSLRPSSNSWLCWITLVNLKAERGELEAIVALVDDAERFVESSNRQDLSYQFYRYLDIIAHRPDMTKLRGSLFDRALSGRAREIRRLVDRGEWTWRLLQSLIPPSSLPSGALNDASYAIAAAIKQYNSKSYYKLLVDTEPDRISLGEGRVVAIASASNSGTLFVGFDNGAVVAFQADTLETKTIASRSSSTVLDIATDPEAELVVVLKSNEDGGATPFVHAHRSDGSYLCIRAIEWDGSWETRITPIVSVEAECLAGIRDGSRFAILRFNPVSIQRRFDLPGEDSPIAAAILPIYDLQNNSSSYSIDINSLDFVGASGDKKANVRGPRVGVLTHNYGKWYWIDIDDLSVREIAGLSWRPEIPEENGLNAYRLSIATANPESFEIVGLGGRGALRRVEALRTPEAIDLLVDNIAVGHDEGYLCATIVEPGVVAAVAKNRVDYLRGGPQKFHLIRSTPMRVENAVGCAVCRKSDELLVVLKDGYLIKTRIYI